MIALNLDYVETRRLRGRADRLRCTIELIMREIVHPGLISVHNLLSQHLLACEELLEMDRVTDDHIALLNNMIKTIKSLSDKYHPHPDHLSFHF